MKFEKYNSLENSYRKKFLDKIAEQGHSGGNWIVQEKIHGANFSLWCDGNNIQGAKRSGFVGGGGADFYNSHVIRERYWENIMEIFRVSKNLTEGTLSHVVIYGELFCGNYPHPDVEKLNYKSVQQGIFYSPDIESRVTNVLIWGDNPVAQVFHETMGYMKPYEGTLYRNGRIVNENVRFYDEHEWRYVPDRSILINNCIELSMQKQKYPLCCN